MRVVRLAVVSWLAALALPGAAAAITATSPTDGATTDSTPAFEWQLAPSEEAGFLELSRDPSLGPTGGFAEGTTKRTNVFASHETSYRVPRSRPLLAGDWYWHVRATRLSDSLSSWSEVRRIRVRDESVRLEDFDLEYLACAKSFYVGVTYLDNNSAQRAIWGVDFRKLRGGRRIARFRGRARDGSILVTRGKPRRLRGGERYVARLFVRDSAGHVTRSRYRRIRISRCRPESLGLAALQVR